MPNVKTSLVRNSIYGQQTSPLDYFCRSLCFKKKRGGEPRSKGWYPEIPLMLTNRNVTVSICALSQFQRVSRLSWISEGERKYCEMVWGRVSLLKLADSCINLPPDVQQGAFLSYVSWLSWQAPHSPDLETSEHSQALILLTLFPAPAPTHPSGTQETIAISFFR